VTRTTSRIAFKKAGRGLVTEDMLSDISLAFLECFGDEAFWGDSVHPKDRVLGKRERSGELKASESTDDEGGPKPQHNIEEEEEDDVGPMPMPNNGSAPRKKRKGM
jgi:hypothetical protein